MSYAGFLGISRVRITATSMEVFFSEFFSCAGKGKKSASVSCIVLSRTALQLRTSQWLSGRLIGRDAASVAEIARAVNALVSLGSPLNPHADGSSLFVTFSVSHWFCRLKFLTLSATAFWLWEFENVFNDAFDFVCFLRLVRLVRAVWDLESPDGFPGRRVVSDADVTI